MTLRSNRKILMKISILAAISFIFALSSGKIAFSAKDRKIFQALRFPLSNVSNLIYNFSQKNFDSNLPKCPKTPPNLVGQIEVDTKSETLEDVEKKLSSQVEAGGRFRPNECQADRVAIVVPCRNRNQHLPVLLKNIHPLLMKQQIDYGIFFVEQSPEGAWNKGKLMNIAFIEALKIYNWDCVIFHDIDLLPLDDRNLYNCPIQPRHMSVAVDTLGWKLPYPLLFGGVTALTIEQFKNVNGFSNSFCGWGGEDDDFTKRIKHQNYRISRYSNEIARYKMISHHKENPNPKRYELLRNWVKRLYSDGLSSLKYKILKIEAKPLFTWIYVDGSPESGF